MNVLEPLLLALGCLLGSAIFSGSETGLYVLSPVSLDVHVRHGHRGAPLVRWLVKRDASVLITILIGNNLLLELLVRMAERHMPAGIEGYWREALVTVLVTPVVFLFGEVLPKELFRRRPLASLSYIAPLLVLARVLFWPLERVLWLLTTALEWSSGARRKDLARRPGRESVLSWIEESAREGALDPEARKLARNALRLRSVRVERAMVPWERVAVVRLAASGETEAAELRRQLARSPHTRLPVVGPDGVVRGYLHQLEVLGGAPDSDPLSRLRPLPALPPSLPVGRALARLRTLGARAALVGDPRAPLGLVTLKDLVEELSGELAGW